MNTRHRISLLIVLFISSYYLYSCTPKQNKLYTINGNTMGTMYAIKYINETHHDLKYEEISQGVNKVLATVNQQMSTYLDDSEISRFNQYRKTDWFDISSDLSNVIHHSIRISSKSNGAFDITIGPLVNLWGFGAEDRPHVIPNDKDIQNRLGQVGYQNVFVRRSPPSIRKRIPDIYCDLSAIAKGYGGDKVAEYLDSQHISNYLVEIGGEVRAKGVNHQNVKWRIGVSTPDKHVGIQKVISLSNCSVATSGDYWNYFEKDNVRYSHTINPKTGRPVTHKLVSVTVIHDSCVIADAFATAINVLGPDSGYDLAVQEDLAVFMIVKDDDGLLEIMTPRFNEIYRSQNKGS